MSYPARVIAITESGELEALSEDQLAQALDLKLILGPSLPVLRDAVYISGAGTVDQAAATTLTTPCIGFVSTILGGGEVLVRMRGILTGFVGLIPGKIYYVDDLTPGGITVTPPSDPGTTIQEIGTALSATNLFVFPDPDYTQN